MLLPVTCFCLTRAVSSHALLPDTRFVCHVFSVKCCYLICVVTYHVLLPATTLSLMLPDRPCCLSCLINAHMLDDTSCCLSHVIWRDVTWHVFSIRCCYLPRVSLTCCFLSRFVTLHELWPITCCCLKRVFPIMLFFLSLLLPQFNQQ
jgi:hypothetical protein